MNETGIFIAFAAIVFVALFFMTLVLARLAPELGHPYERVRARLFLLWLSVGLAVGVGLALRRVFPRGLFQVNLTHAYATPWFTLSGPGAGVFLAAGVVAMALCAALGLWAISSLQRPAPELPAEPPEADRAHDRHGRLLWILVALLAAVGVWGLFIEPNRLEVAELPVPLPRLAPSLDGLVIGHLSDWHLSGSAPSHLLAERACQEVMSRCPQLICLTGDLVKRIVHLPEAVALVRTLQAPLGVYLVLGNHDCDATMEDMLYGQAPDDCAEDEWRAALEGSGAVLLDNETREVEWQGAHVILAGVGDTTAGRDDLPRTLADAPVGDLQILLSHSPDILDEPGSSWADLVLSGHTHGGQLVVPGFGSAWAPVWRLRHRASGLWRLNGTLAFITRGVGSGLRMRINCCPEVALLKLHRGSPEAVPQTRLAGRVEARS